MAKHYDRCPIVERHRPLNAYVVSSEDQNFREENINASNTAEYIICAKADGQLNHGTAGSLLRNKQPHYIL